MRVANAPCSWGALEFEGLTAAEPADFATVLDEIRATGYDGTELGDWGFMPTEPAALTGELNRRALAMVGAFVPVRLADPAAHASGALRAVQTARLLAAVATPESRPGPVLVLADDNGSDPGRTRNAGRITPELALPDADWVILAHGANEIARAVRAETGLPLAFHPHSAGWVETPAEIARFAAATDPDLVGLVFDTGHLTYGQGPYPDPSELLHLLDALGDRVRLVHFKDCSPQIAERARAAEWDYFTAIRHGVFCELGQGAVDFPAIIGRLRERGYAGWIVVEQDVLPGMGAPKESAARNRAYLRGIGV
ncbi:MAG: TIM barrel protein [Thermomicrobiales bacterium]|nr:TIM barrel protein [Thermomicrobiales bacterium]